MNLFRVILILCLLWSTNCTLLDQNSAKSTDPPYFDLSGYIKTYIKDSSLHKVTKTIQIEGDAETKKISDYALWKDILAFDSYDINRPALYDKYSIDTIPTENGSSITYQPKDSTGDLKVTLLQIDYFKDQIQSIRINSTTKSFLEKVRLQIVWTPSSGYTIDRTTDKFFNSAVREQKIEVYLSQDSK